MGSRYERAARAGPGSGGIRFEACRGEAGGSIGSPYKGRLEPVSCLILTASSSTCAMRPSMLVVACISLSKVPEVASICSAALFAAAADTAACAPIFSLVATSATLAASAASNVALACTCTSASSFCNRPPAASSNEACRSAARRCSSMIASRSALSSCFSFASAARWSASRVRCSSSSAAFASSRSTRAERTF